MPVAQPPAKPPPLPPAPPQNTPQPDNATTVNTLANVTRRCGGEMRFRFRLNGEDAAGSASGSSASGL